MQKELIIKGNNFNLDINWTSKEGLLNIINTCLSIYQTYGQEMRINKNIKITERKIKDI